MVDALGFPGEFKKKLKKQCEMMSYKMSWRSPVGEGSGGGWINQELSNGPQKASNVWNDTWNEPKSSILLMHNPVRVCCQMSCSVITLSKIEEV